MMAQEPNRRVVNTNSTYIMLSLQLLLCLFSIAAGLDVLPSTILTSTDGMNVSGNEPFCLLTDRVAESASTRLTNASAKISTNNLSSSLVQISNSFIRPLNGNYQGTVLPNCYNHSVNVTLSTILSDAMNNDYSDTLGIPTMYIGRTYEVVFSISINLLPFLETNGSSQSTTTTTTTTSQSFLPNETQVAVRFFLCNALVLGLCDSILSGENGTLSVDNQQLGNIPPYQAGSVIQGTKNGPHIQSPWMSLTLPQQPQEQPSPTLVANNSSLRGSSSNSNTAIQPIYATQVNLTFQSSNESDAGAYFMLVRTSTAFRIDSNNNETILRQLDVASSLLPTAFALTNPPTILLVSTGMKIYVGMVVGVVGALALAAFVFIVYHRKHPVMKLSQGPFLAAIAGAIFLQVAFSFTELPTRNIFCILRGPMVLLPMEFVAVVILARTWRVHVTLSAATALGTMATDKETKRLWLSSHCCEECYVSFLSHLARLPLMLCKSQPSQSPRGSIRSSASAKETWCLVAILTLPQFFLQVVGVSFYRPTLMLMVDDDAGVGRYMCNKQAQWVNAVGIALVTLATVAAVSMSWVSRKLPTAFNEKEQVFNSAALNAMVAFVTLALSEMMTEPDIPPAVPVFLLTLFSVVTGLITLVILVLPKIRRVMSGEKVVVSALLGARFGSYGNTHLKSNVNHHNESFKITINENDPIPSWMSSHIMDLQDTLQRISDRCNDGRSLLRSDWLRLDKDSRALVADLDRVDFSFLTVGEEVRVPTQTESVVVNSSE